MSQSFHHLLHLFLATMVSVCAFTTHAVANTRETVSQVSSLVNLTEDVDYVITSSTPFANEGIVNIVNTDHAVVILQALRPSEALHQLQHIQIGGERAENNVNCQVKIYNRGSIIMPYSSDIRPLTVYSESHFQGEAVDAFGLENSGGFMNTLSPEKLNNRIHSFKLKRGYMVTFSTRTKGRGYSRCFIADTKDLEMAVLPDVFDGRISSYRIFKWNDTSKSGIANDTRSDPVSKLHVTTCYSFGLGEDRRPDCECVPHHIYEDWPSASSCGSVSYSPHMKTNNEPGNSVDDHPQTVNEILANWENLMATGMRLCSPSSHDGSLYHLHDFLDSIDARGWRCDIIDLHCYWPEGSFNTIKGNWVDRHHRPVWISEWVWGASWNNNGIFGIATGSYRDNPTENQLQQNKNAVKNICSKLNSWDYIERYFYWNSEANCSKLYLSNGTLTPAGEYYAGMDTGLGYNGHYEFVPTNPRTSVPTAFRVSYDKTTHHATLTWSDSNGEFNQLMTVERKTPGGEWETVATIPFGEDPGSYTYEDDDSNDGHNYRIHLVDYKGDHLYSPELTAMPDEVEAGDAINVSGEVMYVGGNLFANGDFALGATDWQDGSGQDLRKPYFSISAVGGPLGGPYLQSWTNMAADQAGSLRKRVDIVPGQTYYFSAHSRGNGGSYQRISFTSDGITEGNAIKRLDKSTDWTHHFTMFQSGNNSQAILAFRWLGAQSQFANLTLCRLFNTREEAIADGINASLKRAQAVMAYNTIAPALNTRLQETIDQVSALTEPKNDDLKLLNDEISRVLEGMRDKPSLDELLLTVDKGLAFALPGAGQLRQAADEARNITDYSQALVHLRSAWQEYLPLLETDHIKSPDFDGTEGWTLRCGTYTQGVQYPTTKNGRSCWLARWSDLSATEGKAATMQVRQTLTSTLTHGIYVLQCAAATEHNCLSDQHGYLVVSGDTLTTSNLRLDRQDLPTVPDDQVWQTMTTIPVYINDDDAVEVGFVGSKAGAEDGTWLEYANPSSVNDLREGSWCATGFRLLHSPLYRRQAERSSYGTICLPYAATASDSMKVYRIAGLLADSTKICLEEVDRMEAGVPYIYYTEKSDVVFYETGEAVEEPTLGANNLRGYLRTNSRTNVGNYVMVGNGFYLVTSGHRQRISSYTALITSKDGMEVLDSYDGPTLTISETPWQDIADGISSPKVHHPHRDGLYRPDGRRVHKGERHAPGLYIQERDGVMRKVILRD